MGTEGAEKPDLVAATDPRCSTGSCDVVAQRRCFPARHSSHRGGSLVTALDQDFHDFAAPFHLLEARLHLLQRVGLGDEPFQRKRS